MNNYEIEPSFSVYDNHDGTCIKVGVSPDFPELLLIHTPDKKSQDFYGDVRLNLSKEHAKLLANAIYAQIEAMNKQEDD